MIIQTTIEEVIARVEDWQGKEVVAEIVPGGITNPNYKVTVDGKPYFVKFLEQEQISLIATTVTLQT